MTTKSELDLPSAAELGRLVGVRNKRGRTYPLDPTPAHKLGDVAWVHAFGRLRRGRVVKVGRTRVSVAYVAPSRPEVVRVGNDLAAYVYPDARAAESGAS